MAKDGANTRSESQWHAALTVLHTRQYGYKSSCSGENHSAGTLGAYKGYLPLISTEANLVRTPGKNPPPKWGCPTHVGDPDLAVSAR